MLRETVKTNKRNCVLNSAFNATIFFFLKSNFDMHVAEGTRQCARDELVGLVQENADQYLESEYLRQEKYR